MIKLIIFDLDGTLINSIYDITDAVNFALSSFSDKTYNVEQVRQFVGSGFKMLLKQAAPREEIQEELQKKFLSYYWQNLTKKTLPYDGVIDTLKQLNVRKKAVVTNKKESFSREILKNLKLETYFDTVVGGDSTPYKKPSPEPLCEVLKRFTIAPHEALMVGDGEHDIEAGRAAGMKTVAVTYGYRDKEQIKDADFLINDMRHLIPLLSKIEKKYKISFFEKSPYC
jgi:phosphoglycolate phosphatase